MAMPSPWTGLPLLPREPGTAPSTGTRENGLTASWSPCCGPCQQAKEAVAVAWCHMCLAWIEEGAQWLRSWQAHQTAGAACCCLPWGWEWSQESLGGGAGAGFPCHKQIAFLPTWLGRKGLSSSCRGDLESHCLAHLEPRIPLHRPCSPSLSNPIHSPGSATRVDVCVPSSTLHCSHPVPGLTHILPQTQAQPGTMLSTTQPDVGHCAHHPAVLSGAALQGQEPGSFPGAGAPCKAHMMGAGFHWVAQGWDSPWVSLCSARAPCWAHRSKRGGEPLTCGHMGAGLPHEPPADAERCPPHPQPGNGWLSPGHWQGSPALPPLQLLLPAAWPIPQVPRCPIQLQLKSLQAGWSLSRRKQCS